MMDEMSKLVQAVMLLTRFQEVPGSNLGWDTNYLTEVFCGYLWSPQVNAKIVP
jgi:hypothetical protein